MESARRWSGFVCPDCRFVFRVPRDHDGSGVVCPSCRRMLRIPAAGDRPAPLMVPIRQPSAPQEPAVPTGSDAEDPQPRKRKRSRHGESHSWDSTSGKSRHSSRREKRQMVWILIGAGGLLLLILAGVAAALYGGGEGEPVPPQASASLPSMDQAPPAAQEARSEPPFESVAEPLARQFLEAKRVDSLLPLVRNPELAAKRMARLHPDGTVLAPGLSAFNLNSDVIRQGSIATVRVRTQDFDERILSFALTPEGWKVDWESWVGWSDLPWSEFRTQKPSTPGTFRVNLKDVEYYNRTFAEESQWKSFLLETPEGAVTLYGYVSRDSPLASRLKPSPDAPTARYVLSLRFPENPEADNQVIIESVLAEGWALENEPSP